MTLISQDNLFLFKPLFRIKRPLGLAEEAEPILAERVQSGKLKIVAARYDLDTGKIDLLTR